MEKGIQPSEIDNLEKEDLIRWTMFVMEREKMLIQARGI
jgi:hypothetical protein